MDLEFFVIKKYGAGYMRTIISFCIIIITSVLTLSCSSFDKDLYFKETTGLKKKVRVAVLPFQDDRNAKGSGVNVADALTNELIKFSTWDIVERVQIEKVIKEQAFEATGMTEADYSKLGKLTNVDYFITGSVGQYIYNMRDPDNVKIRFAINMRFIDTTKGKVIGTGRYCYQTNKNYLRSCCLFSWIFIFVPERNIERELSVVAGKIARDMKVSLGIN